jgi:hypothetical protein
MVRISRTSPFNNNRSLRASGLYTRGPRVRTRMPGRLVRADVHTVLDDAHSRRIRTCLSLHLRVMYWLSFTAVRVAQDGAPYEFLNLYMRMVFSRFRWGFSKKRLELKSLKRHTKAEELRTPRLFIPSLRLSLKAL